MEDLVLSFITNSCIGEFNTNLFVCSSQAIFIYSLIDFKPLTYEDYDYPDWADGIGWGLSCLSIIQIPLWAIICICRQDGPTWKEVPHQAYLCFSSNKREFPFHGMSQFTENPEIVPF